ncbi:DUF4314 domain-containing protein [Streptomyces xiamenensis]|uniref:DUF4314 domain-containing protein n=1 Tax=Streptomyces xiamenensis TaxID=408015 RepID=UPI0035D6FF7A
MAEFTAGDRIEVLSCSDPYDPIPPGATGTVKYWMDHPEVRQLVIAWDPPHAHRRLALTLTPGEDSVKLLD